MPKLTKLELDSAVANYTPRSGRATLFYKEENGEIVAMCKTSTGDVKPLFNGIKPLVPESCIAYLGSNGCMYIREDSGIIVSGLERVSANDRAHGGHDWYAYGPFTQLGPLAGSVLSQPDTYLQWAGFTDTSKKWTIHSQLAACPMTEEYWSGTLRIGWGFGYQEESWGDQYATYNLSCLCFALSLDNGLGFVAFRDDYEWFSLPAGARLPYAVTWDGPRNQFHKLFRYPRTQTIATAGDTEMGMPGELYSVGDKVYLGCPAGAESLLGGVWGEAKQSGLVIAAWALEDVPADQAAADTSYTSLPDYLSPFMVGLYKYL